MVQKQKNNLKVKEVAFFGKKILNSKSKILVKKNKYYESTNLSLNSSKSRRLLKWKTVLTAKEALKSHLIGTNFITKIGLRVKLLIIR